MHRFFAVIASDVSANWPFTRRRQLAEMVEEELQKLSDEVSPIRIPPSPVNTIGVLAKMGWLRDHPVIGEPEPGMTEEEFQDVMRRLFEGEG